MGERDGSPLFMPCSYAAVEQRLGITVWQELVNIATVKHTEATERKKKDRAGNTERQGEKTGDWARGERTGANISSPLLRAVTVDLIRETRTRPQEHLMWHLWTSRFLMQREQICYEQQRENGSDTHGVISAVHVWPFIPPSFYPAAITVTKNATVWESGVIYRG